MANIIKKTSCALLLIAVFGAVRGQAIQSVAPEEGQKRTDACFSSLGETKLTGWQKYGAAAALGIGKGLTCLTVPGIMLEKYTFK
jgi:hypothetical protein